MLATALPLVQFWRPLTLLGWVALAAACGTGPDEKRDTVQYQFALAAFGGDTTADRARYYDCVVAGFFQLPKPVPLNGTVRFPVTISRHLSEQRGTHSETTSADSIISEAVVEYTGLGGDSLSFTLGAGPYVITLGPGAEVPRSGEYAGSWSCDVEVPLAGDSTLGAYGYDPNLEIPGTWRISELLPIG
jgi:hypothetical protein